MLSARPKDIEEKTAGCMSSHLCGWLPQTYTEVLILVKTSGMLCLHEIVSRQVDIPSWNAVFKISAEEERIVLKILTPNVEMQQLFSVYFCLIFLSALESGPRFVK